jgi:hypothetical protein
MEFRLTYSGPLRPSQKDPLQNQPEPLAEHKQSLRRKFHPQIKRLWETTPMLQARWPVFPASNVPSLSAGQSDLGAQYSKNGWRYYPLVREHPSLSCWLDILMLRADRPAGVVYAGDIDNRIKTLIDGLRVPRSINELGGDNKPRDGEDPFFCLLADDSLVTKLTVETDALLEPFEGRQMEPNDVRLLVTVRLHPYQTNMSNVDFV